MKKLQNEGPPVVVRVGSSLLVKYLRVTWRCSISALLEAEPDRDGFDRNVVPLKKSPGSKVGRESVLKMRFLGKVKKEERPLFVAIKKTDELRAIFGDRAWGCALEMALRPPLPRHLKPRSGKIKPRKSRKETPEESIPPAITLQRQRGGFPISAIKEMRSALMLGNAQGPLLSARIALRKFDVLSAIAQLLDTALQQAMDDDEECGLFFAEIIPALAKKANSLSAKNRGFKKAYPKIQHFQFPRGRTPSPLLMLVNSFIAEAMKLRRSMELLQDRRISEKVASRFTWPSEAVASLPQLEDSKEVVQAWTDYLMSNPQFNEACAQDQRVREINKALGKKGVFTISRLQRPINKAIARVARMPRFYYPFLLPNN